MTVEFFVDLNFKIDFSILHIEKSVLYISKSINVYFNNDDDESYIIHGGFLRHRIIWNLEEMLDETFNVGDAQLFGNVNFVNRIVFVVINYLHAK